jgi:hypothetical protein
MLPIVSLTDLPGDELHRPRHFARPAVLDQRMNMIPGNDVVEDAEPIAMARLPHPSAPFVPVAFVA